MRHRLMTYSSRIIPKNDIMYWTMKVFQNLKVDVVSWLIPLSRHRTGNL